MGVTIDQRRAGWRGVFLTLALLALAMKVAAPPGFMFAPTSPGSPFTLMICTGHGPLILGTSHHKGGASQSKSEAPCAFAGHAAPPTPAFGPEIAVAAYAHAIQPTAIRFDLVPGRGLAAPPPPSQGPPTLL